MTTQYNLTGMNCGSCALSIQTAVAEIPHVQSARVDFNHGVLTIDSEEPIEETLVQDTITALGAYQLTPLTESSS